MADYPPYAKNKQTPTRAVTVTPPTYNANDSRSAEQRWLDQQWRDVAETTLGARHPLALNRDSDYVTTDPYEGGT